MEKISQKALSILSLLVEKEGWTGKCLIQKECFYSRSSWGLDGQVIRIPVSHRMSVTIRLGIKGPVLPSSSSCQY